MPNKFNKKFLPTVIFPLIISGDFLVSAMAASGMPQFATGPQKWVLKVNKLIILYSFYKIFQYTKELYNSSDPVTWNPVKFNV